MALLRCSLGSQFLSSFTTALSLHGSHPTIELFCRVSGALWTLSVYGAGDLQFSGCHQRSGLLLLHCLSNLQQQWYCLPIDAKPWDQVTSVSHSQIFSLFMAAPDPVLLCDVECMGPKLSSILG